MLKWLKAKTSRSSPEPLPDATGVRVIPLRSDSEAAQMTPQERRQKTAKSQSQVTTLLSELRFDDPEDAADPPPPPADSEDLPPSLSSTAIDHGPSMISSGLQELLSSNVGRRFLLAFAYANFQEELVLSWQLLQTMPDPPPVDAFSTFVNNFVRHTSPLHIKMPDQLSHQLINLQTHYDQKSVIQALDSVKALLVDRLRALYVPFKSTVLAVVRFVCVSSHCVSLIPRCF